MQPERAVTPEAYLAFDAEAETRHEYWHGEVVAMAGESYAHNAVKDDLVAALRQRPACDVLSSGLRVRAPGYGRASYAYPDVVVLCEPPAFDEATQLPTLLNPSVLVEVTSASTRGRDFSDKLEAYFRLESLVEYWIAEADRPYVLRYERTEGGLLVHMIAGAERALASDALGVAIPLRDLYRRALG